jgi:hypothetical protein
MATIETEPGTLRGTEQPTRIHRVGMTSRKRIALIAHDNRKDDLLEWARYNSGTLSITSSSAPAPPGASSPPSSACR